MVKNSTLLYWVNGFENTAIPVNTPITPDETFEDDFLAKLLEPLVFDPGDELVKSTLRHS